MNLSRQIQFFWALLIWLAPSASALARSPLPGQSWTYTLLSGSQLADDCPICDRATINLPLRGTFQLQLLESNPLSSKYELTKISLHTTDTTGRTYQVAGSGTYQQGSEVAVQQALSLDVEVNDGFTNSTCLFTNATSAVQSPWPVIQADVDQSNGTLLRIYHLILFAAPVPQFQSVQADPITGNVRLDWRAYGGGVQLEKARAVAGPYQVLATNLTVQSFEDIGALTGQAQAYYRLLLP